MPLTFNRYKCTVRYILYPVIITHSATSGAMFSMLGIINSNLGLRLKVQSLLPSKHQTFFGIKLFLYCQQIDVDCCYLPVNLMQTDF